MKSFPYLPLIVIAFLLLFIPQKPKAQVLPPPSVFFANDTVGCIPLEVHFWDSLTTRFGFSVDWRVWHFGDGDTSILENPTHTYNHSGIYDVMLIFGFVDSSGMSVDTVIKEDFINATKLNVSATLINETCNMDNGAINLSVTGGLPAYFVMWSNGDTTLTVDNLPAGSHTVVIEDMSGCRFQETYQISNSNNNLSLSGNIEYATNAQTADGIINLAVSGGSSPYTFNWVTTGDSTEDLSGLTPGTYCVLVTDANGCIEDKCFTVGTQGGCNNFSLTGNVHHTSCNTADGSVSITVSGGTPPYYYVWSNGDDDPLIDNLSQGTYSVVVEDTFGCRLSETFVVQRNQGYQFSVHVTDASTPSAQDGSIDLSVSGGTPPFSFLWSNGATTEDISGLAAGTYCVIITDATGCSEDPCFVVENPGCNNFSIGDQVTHIGCNGFPQGAINLTVSGGVPPYYYVWSNGSHDEDISNLSAGMYSVTVEDSSSCREVRTYTIGYAGGFQITGTVTNATGGAANGVIQITVNGGTAPYLYSWDGGTTYITWPNHDNLSPGTYCVLVKDANGCVEDKCFTVGAQGGCGGFRVTAWNDIYLCGPGSTVLEANVFDGTAPYSYEWIPTAGLTDSSNRITAAQVNNTTTFIVTATDDHGCVASDTVIVYVSSAPGNIGVIEDSLTICAGDSVKLSAFGGQSYFWDPTSTVSDPHNNDPLAFPLHTTTYHVEITDSACTYTYYVYVAVDDDCVWPGDANADGISNNNDILAIGIGYGINGPTRPNATINWEGQYAPDWLLALASGPNLKHVDCNGDGIINAIDTVAVSQNYGFTHNRGSNTGRRAIDPELFFEIPTDTALAGTEIDVPVYLGRDTLPVNNFYGIAFSVNYDSTLVEKNTMQFTPAQSYIGTPGQNLLSFDKDLYGVSKVDIALTRTNQINVSGHGLIGVLSFTMKDDISGKNTIIKALTLSFSDVNAISLQENEIPIFYGSSTIFITQEVTGIKDLGDLPILIYPNPAHDRVLIQTHNESISQLTVFNLMGEVVLSQANLTNNLISVDLSEISQGTYFIRINTANRIIVRQLILY